MGRRIYVSRRSDDVAVLPFFNISRHLSVYQGDDPPAHDIDVLTGMGRHDDGGSPGVQLRQQMQQIPDDVVVQVGGELIQQQLFSTALASSTRRLSPMDSSAG